MNAQVDPALIANARQAIAFLRVGLAVFSHRMLMTMALLGSIGLAAWAMYQPDWMKVAVLGLYLLMVNLPLVITRPAKENGHEEG